MAINFNHQTDQISVLENITINAPGALKLPSGTTLQRPTVPLSGQLRFNITDNIFEGYDGTAWGSLGGVKDGDQDTYISAESTPGDDNDELRFFTAGTERMIIGNTGDFGFGDNLTEFTIEGATGDTVIAGKLRVDGDVTVNGTTTTVNSTTVTIDDPIFTLGGDTAPTLDDNKDRGIEFNYFDTTAKAGFFGYDDSAHAFTFIPDAINTNEAFSGTAGDAIFGNMGLGSATINSIRLGVTAANEIDTTAGNLVLDSTGGTVEIDDDATISGTLGVTGKTTLASAIVSDLTDNRIVIAGTDGALEDDANFKFNGTIFQVGTAFDVTTATGAVNTGALDAGETILTSATISDLTDNRVVLAGTDGAIEDSANLTFDGTLLNLTGNFDVSGNVTISSTGAIVLPVGTVAQRPTPNAQGMMRYNSDDTTFEGYDGTAWGSLGGVKDVDQDTYISAETTPGDDNDELNFYTAGTERMVIGDTGQITAAATYTPIADQDLLTKTYAENSLVVTAGTPTDGTWTDGAYLGFTDTDKVVDILDELNESLENVRNNTFVRSVSFIGAPLSGGQGTTVTLNLTVDGNSNRYDIDWGDGSNTNGTADSTPTHTYTSIANSPFTVIVRAYHNGATVGSAGSEALSTQTNYIIIYTADPVPSYDLYRDLATGTALTGNNLYVIEGDSLYLENNTTNTLMADVTYSVDWADGSVDDAIANDAVAGGVTGARLQHTWAPGTNTGNGLDTTSLTLDSHTTADPAVIPTALTKQIKVYDPNIATPDGLNTKTIAFANDEGANPRLASGATDLTAGTTLVAGDDVDLNNNISSPFFQLETSDMSTYAYDANNGTLEAKINGLGAGSRTLTGGNDAGTYGNLVITDEEDYNLLNADGSATSFNNSIYHPGLYSGFKAKLSIDPGDIAIGINSFQLSHSTTGDTNLVEFVKDDIFGGPIATAGTVSENNAGTYRYISGIPYYNSGNPSLTLSGVTVDRFIGQAYRNMTQVLGITHGPNLEGTTQASVSNQSYTYAQIDGATSFLTGGIPNANTGNGTPYTLGDLTVNITSSSVRTVENIRHRMHNIYNSSSYVTPSEIIQVHRSAQSGISEIAIAVSDALGATYNDDAVRVFDFSADTTNNPTIPGATNFYTNSVYTEAADPGVVGTKEATIRLGVLEHNVTNYSTGYLPVGPNRSADTGTQYLTFAFRRTVVANFTINITSASGVAGVWIAAPGTTIDDSSTINGWLDCGIQYNGAGVPGANTGNGGNGSNGCAVTGADIISASTPLTGGYSMTLGTENMTNATNNVALIRIALDTNQTITGLSIT